MTTKAQQKIENSGGGHEVTGLATALAGASQWVQIFPAAAEWFGNDGRGPYRMPVPQTVVDSSMVAQVLEFAMIDRDHARQLAHPGTPVKAAGWFKRYEVRADGSVWGEAEWTDSARAELSSREFRYFSPSFQVDRDTGDILRITGGSLTNTPNFRQLQALAAEEKQQNPTLKETKSMKPELLALATALGLTKAASEDEILAAAINSHTAHEKLKVGLKTIADKLKVSDSGNIEALASAIDKKVETSDETASQKSKIPDPEKFVPREMFDELATRMSALEADTKSTAATKAVDEAIAAGKIAPAQKAWANEYASANLKGFNDFIAAAPKIVDAEEVATQKHVNAHGGLSREDVEVAKQMGVDIEKLKTANKQDDKAAA